MEESESWGILQNGKRVHWLGPEGWGPRLHKNHRWLAGCGPLSPGSPYLTKPCLQVLLGLVSLRFKIQVPGREVLNGPSGVTQQWSGVSITRRSYYGEAQTQVCTSGLGRPPDSQSAPLLCHTPLSGHCSSLIPVTAQPRKLGAICMLMKDVQRPKAFV